MATGAVDQVKRPSFLRAIEYLSPYASAVSVIMFLLSVASVYVGVKMAIADNKRMVEFAQKHSESVKIDAAERANEVKKDLQDQVFNIKKDINDRLTRLELAIDNVNNNQSQVNANLLEIKLILQQKK